MRSPALLLVLASLALGCSSEASSDAPGALDAGTADATSEPAADAGSEADAPYDGPDFSALDPSKCGAAAAEDTRGFDRAYAWPPSASAQQDKSFYVLTLLGAAPASTALAADATLAGYAASRAAAIPSALDGCAGDASCLGAAFVLPDAEIAASRAALSALVASSTAVAAAAHALRASGQAYGRATGSDAELLGAAWEDAVRALGGGWSYVAGLDATARTTIIEAQRQPAAGAPAWAPLLATVLAGLQSDGRDEATRYEPLAAGENAAVLARIATLDFTAYRFAAIVVPGLGPGDLAQALSLGGQIRCDQAAERYRAGLAPVIVLSGGHVHPDRTPYAEALEMKKYLKATYAIADDALLVDPHARHTTTNLRNVARLFLRYGVPTDQASLVTSDFGQTLYMALTGDADVFGKRCLDELGYKPWRAVVKLDTLDDCWLPSATSLQVGAGDLLDP